MYSGKLSANNPFGHFQVVGGLQVNPVLRCLTKRFAKKQRQFSGDWSVSLNDMGDSHGGYSDGSTEFGLRNIQFVKNFFQKFARMNRGKVIFDLHVFQLLNGNLQSQRQRLRHF